MPEAIIFEDAERQIIETTSAINPDAPGGWRSRRTVYKPNSPGANEIVIRDRARTALAQNATYLALATPTAAQNTAQVKRLTRECNGLIRLLLAELQDVSDT